MTSNLAFSEWNRVFVDDKLTAALLHRLAQHADVLVTRGPGDRGPAQSKRSEPKEEKTRMNVPTAQSAVGQFVLAVVGQFLLAVDS
jgi:hypothetical protein